MPPKSAPGRPKRQDNGPKWRPKRRVRPPIRAEARPAFEGLGSGTAAGTVTAVTPKHRAEATVVTNPSVTFTGSSLSSSGSWSITTLSNAGSTHDDDLVVYTDMGAPSSEPIRDVHSGFSPIEATDITEQRFVDADLNKLRIDVGTTASSLISSSSFPGGGNLKTFDDNFDGKDADTEHDRVRISGRYDGASGTFECSGTCTITHRGGDVYEASSGWTFITSASARVSVDDDSYMYFGWWKRDQKTPRSLTFATFSGGAHEVDDIPNDLTGTATYTGQAAGQYAIYQPAGGESGTGSFTASAELTANFGAADAEGTLSGRVTDFSNDPDWSLTLMSQGINAGAVERPGDPVANPSVSWTIGTHTETGGAWDAKFFSDVDGSTAIPEGVAGTFSAQFGEVGRLVGAFGAHCPTTTCPRN